MFAFDDEPDFAAWQRHPLFRPAGNDATAAFAAAAFHERCDAGAMIDRSLRDEAVVHVLLHGVARTFVRSAQGLEHTLAFVVAPGLIGDPTTAHLEPAVEAAHAETSCVVATVAASSYRRFLAEQPTALQAHAQHLSATLVRRTRLELARHAAIEERLADLLLVFSFLFGARADGREHIEHALSQDCVARYLGVVRRSVASSFARLSRRGVVRRTGDRLAIVDRAALERAATPAWSAMIARCGDELVSLEPLRAREEDALEIVSGRHRGRRVAVIDAVVIGRSPEADLPVPDETASPRHARVYRTARGGRLWIEDLASVNGTLVAGRPISRTRLDPGDEITVGVTRIVLSRTPSTRGHHEA